MVLKEVGKSYSGNTEMPTDDIVPAIKYLEINFAYFFVAFISKSFQ